MGKGKLIGTWAHRQQRLFMWLKRGCSIVQGVPQTFGVVNEEMQKFAKRIILAKASDELLLCLQEFTQGKRLDQIFFIIVYVLDGPSP